MGPWFQRAAAVLAATLGWTLMVVLPAGFLALLAGGFFGDDPRGAALAATRAALAVGLGFGAWYWLKRRLLPVSWTVRRNFPGARETGRQVACGRHRRAAVWIAPGEGIQGYALSGIAGSAVVLAEPVLRLPEAEQEWLMAHEASHLRHGDPRARGWWMAGIDTLNRAARLAGLGHRLLRRIPLLGRLAGLYHRLARWAVRAALGLFRLLDRAVERAIEYRADKEAGAATHPLAGASLLRRLSRPLEPTFDLFATHPPVSRRVARLERQAAKVDAREGLRP